MTAIAIITDTDSSLPEHIAAQMSIRQVPITIHFDDKLSFTCGVDIDDERLFAIVDKSHRLPTTAAPSPAAFAAAYANAFAEGAESIICICVSSKISGTYSSAVSACEQFPGRDITVIDSLSVSMAQGFMALAGAEAARAGCEKAEVLARIESVRQRLHLFAMLPTLKYLALSGRVGKFVAGMADTLNIKPLLTMREGKLDLLEKVRTRKKAVERMLSLTSQSLNGRAIQRAAVIHVANPEGARELETQLRALLPCPAAIDIIDFGPGLSVHTGSGVVGLVVVAATE